MYKNLYTQDVVNYFGFGKGCLSKIIKDNPSLKIKKCKINKRNNVFTKKTIKEIEKILSPTKYFYYGSFTKRINNFFNFLVDTYISNNSETNDLTVSFYRECFVRAIATTPSVKNVQRIFNYFIQKGYIDSFCFIPIHKQELSKYNVKVTDKFVDLVKQYNS